jgi:hypothetical protein
MMRASTSPPDSQCSPEAWPAGICTGIDEWTRPDLSSKPASWKLLVGGLPVMHRPLRAQRRQCCRACLVIGNQPGLQLRSADCRLGRRPEDPVQIARIEARHLAMRYVALFAPFSRRHQVVNSLSQWAAGTVPRSGSSAKKARRASPAPSCGGASRGIEVRVAALGGPGPPVTCRTWQRTASHFTPPSDSFVVRHPPIRPAVKKPEMIPGEIN